MRDNTGGGQASATAAKPKRAAAPKSPAKSAHQLRIERLFEWAMAASIAGHTPALRDATLSALDVANAFTTWKLTVPGYMQRIVAARVVQGKPIKEIAAAEDITLEIARQLFGKAMLSFESIIAKLEGPDLTPDEKAFVPVMRRVTGDRAAAAPFMMRSANAEVERMLGPEMQDACNEIEFCFRYLAGELTATTNLRAYGILPGRACRDHLEAKAEKLVPVYRQWITHLQTAAPATLVVVRSIVLEGCGLRQASTRARLADPRMAKPRLLAGLNEYCIRAGMGDVLGEYKQHDPGYVCVIGANEAGPFKVGYSRTPKARLAQLQVGSPQPLRILFLMRTGAMASKESENEIDDYLKDNRIRGDWFDVRLDTVIEALRIIHPAGVEKDH